MKRDWRLSIPFLRGNMDINKFLEDITRIIKELETIVDSVENNLNVGIQKMNKTIETIKDILPEWFFFIEQTGIGEKQEILTVLNDIEYGMKEKDSVCLADAVAFGLRELLITYKNVIEEALDGE